MKKLRFSHAPWRPLLALATTVFMNPASLAETTVRVPGKDRAGQPLTSRPLDQPAQSVKAGERSTDSQAMQEQRRMELRAALRANKRKLDEAASASAAAAALTEYHLSAQERAEMRQQLGQQLRPVRVDSDRAKP